VKTSIFEIFQVGIGPSGAHAAGQIRAARDVVFSLDQNSRLSEVARLTTQLLAVDAYWQSHRADCATAGSVGNQSHGQKETVPSSAFPEFPEPLIVLASHDLVNFAHET
jgi:L-serine dehydratase